MKNVLRGNVGAVLAADTGNLIHIDPLLAHLAAQFWLKARAVG
jgi:hypothetical protein